MNYCKHSTLNLYQLSTLMLVGALCLSGCSGAGVSLEEGGTFASGSPLPLGDGISIIPQDTPDTDESTDGYVMVSDSSDVSESTTDPLIDNSFALNEVSQDLMRSLAGYQVDQLAPLVDELTATIIEGLDGEVLESAAVTLFDTQSGTTVTEPVLRVRYSCTGGGTVVREVGNALFVNGGIYRLRRVDGYLFDQCNTVSSGISLPDDSYTINGSLNLVKNRFSTSGYSSTVSTYTWTEFDLQSDTTLSYELDGYVKTTATSSSSGSASSRESEIDVYRKTLAAETIMSIDDGVFELTRSSSGGGSIQTYTVDVSGVIAGLSTNGQRVQVNTESTLSRQRGVGFSTMSNEPFSGQVDFLSEDGSFLFLTGNPTVAASTGESDRIPDFVALNLVDSAYTKETGERIEERGIVLEPFTVIAPGCNVIRDEDTDGLVCDGGELFVLP